MVELHDPHPHLAHSCLLKHILLSVVIVSVDRNEGLETDDGDLDRVSDLPSLPGSRKTSEQMRKLSGKCPLST